MDINTLNQQIFAGKGVFESLPRTITDDLIGDVEIISSPHSLVSEPFLEEYFVKEFKKEATNYILQCLNTHPNKKTREIPELTLHQMDETFRQLWYGGWQPTHIFLDYETLGDLHRMIANLFRANPADSYNGMSLIPSGLIKNKIYIVDANYIKIRMTRPRIRNGELYSRMIVLITAPSTHEIIKIRPDGEVLLEL